MSEPRPPSPWRDIFDTIESAGVGHAITTRDGVIKWCSPACRKHLQVDLSGPKARVPWFLLDPAPKRVHNDRAALWDRFIRRDQPWQGMVRWHVSPTDIHYYEGTAKPLANGDVVMVINDRTDLIKTDRTLKATEKLQRQVLEDLPIMVCVTDTDRQITFMTQYVPVRLGQRAEDFIGRSLEEVLGESFSDPGRTLLKDPDAPISGYLTEVRDGPLAGTEWLMMGRTLKSRSGKILGFLTLAIDRTDSARLREERAQFAAAVHEAQKITALNDFAGSLAHEISNLLQPVTGYAQLLAGDPDLPDRQRYAEKIHQSTMEAGRILKRTLTMTRSEMGQLQKCDVGTVLEQTLASGKDLAPSGLTYQADLPTFPLTATAHPGELKQVLLNIFNNAAEAMGQKGQISVGTQIVNHLPKAADHLPSGKPPFLVIEIGDEGPGIPPQLQRRIFEPFVTTKSDGRGAGLGLAVVQGLVTGWGGVVTVTSTPGRGTVFSIWIPYLSDPQAKEG